MRKKIFISYKHGDKTVYGKGITVNDYVESLKTTLTDLGHVDMSESKDLSQLPNQQTRDALAERIFNTTVTIVIISPQMKEAGVQQKDQWIPWEIRYSLQTRRRKPDNKSYPNAMVAIVLPDTGGSYDYCIEENICPRQACNAIEVDTDKLFPILSKNMFNIKDPEYTDCPHHEPETIFSGESCYIDSVKWSEFTDNPNKHIKAALDRQRNRNNYQINANI